MAHNDDGSRFTRLRLEGMDVAQRAVADAILAGPRKSLDGPFSAMLHSPQMADPMQALGAAVRFNTRIPATIRELAILLVARRWKAQFEWHVHRLHALELGLDAAICDAIEAQRRPERMSAAEEAAYDFCHGLLETGSVTDAAFDAVAGAFGESGTVDLIATIGYYTTVSFLLNADRYPVPEGARLLE